MRHVKEQQHSPLLQNYPKKWKKPKLKDSSFDDGGAIRHHLWMALEEPWPPFPPLNPNYR